MLSILGQWYRNYFSSKQAIVLAFLIIVSAIGIMLFGGILAPVLAAIILAYMMEGLVARMQQIKVPRLLAVIIVLLFFIILCLVIFLGVMPILIKQVSSLVKELPAMVERGQEILLLLPERYPTIFKKEQIQSIIDTMQQDILSMGQSVVSFSIAQAADIFTFLVYIILMPMMVFFALKDKQLIIEWCKRFLPAERELANEVWKKVDIKIGSYIRGKFIEIMIIWSVTFVSFKIMGINYAMLLGFLVGISVIIPYVGAIAVTIPVALIAYFQWGLSSDFWSLMAVYLVIQIVDGNIIVPLLFSEVVNIHPVAIIVAIIFFGGLWGVWGIFFAIPLATLVDTVVNAWPEFDDSQSGEKLLAEDDES